MEYETNDSQIRILTPNDVAKLMPFVSESWIYDHWEDLGGVTDREKEIYPVGGVLCQSTRRANGGTHR
jgi:hypothetical protein